jgi:hypothetical protein
MKTLRILPAVVCLSCLAVELNAHVLGGVANWDVSLSANALNGSPNEASRWQPASPEQDLLSKNPAIAFALLLPGTVPCRTGLGEDRHFWENDRDENHERDDDRNRFEGEGGSAQIPELSGTSLGMGVVALTGILVFRRRVTVRA